MAEKNVKRRNRTFWSKVALFALFAIVVIYTAYHLISLFLSEDVRTIVSGVTTEKITVGGDGYVFRDETVLRSQNSGAVDYLVDDGSKVAVGQALANVYQSGGGEQAQGLISVLDRQIAVLEECAKANSVTSDLSQLRKIANDTYFTISRLITSGQAGELDYQIEKMMLTLSKISVITNGNASVNEMLEELEKTRDGMLVGDFEEMRSTESGYFYSTVDGYEDVFSTEALENLTPEAFRELAGKVSEGKVYLSRTCGKLASDKQWNFVLPIAEKDAEKLNEGESYNLNFPEKNNTTLPMKLEKKIEDKEEKKILLVFSCTRLPENFTIERCMTAQIERSSISGIYVPKTAVKKENGVYGVYVLRGSVAHFRLIEIIYEGSDYFIVEERNDGDGKYYYLGSNELIITNGKNLFDGRILE